MSTQVVHAREHRFSSVPAGLFPEQGRGFQTFAVSQELVGTEDLRVLERAALYAVSRERRARGDLPVNHTFFRLPSGSYALGRTQDCGTDALGREGNYLTQHWVVDGETLRAFGGNPFGLWDILPWSEAQSDRKPKYLPLWEGKVEMGHSVPERNLPWPQVADLVSALLRANGKTVLVIEETDALALLRGVFAILPIEERMALTFSTHFYRAEALRPFYALVMVASHAEAPSDRSAYLSPKSDSSPSADNTYAGWLREQVRRGQWQQIEAVNGLLDQLRAESMLLSGESLTADGLTPDAYRALWDRAGERVFPLLYASPFQIQGFLEACGSSTPADALLAAASPSLLLGSQSDADTTSLCLKLLESRASSGAWRQWRKRWRSDPVLAAFQPQSPWWRR